MAVAAGPGFLPELHRRHVAKVTGVGAGHKQLPLGTATRVRTGERTGITPTASAVT